MSANSPPTPTLPSPWGEFLDEVEKLLSRPVEIHCLGGFVLTVLYGRPLPTADIDYITAVPGEEVQTLQTIGGPDSNLAKKYKVHLQFVTVADVPEDYESRLVDIFPERFSRLRLRALDAHDIVLSKLTRNNPIDESDVEFLAGKSFLDAVVLEERYRRELRPNLANQERHDLTLKFWLEDYFRV